MPRYEYKVVPAPTRGLKGRGIRGAEAKFANAIETLMNDLGADGWEYQRADTLPMEERAGITGTETSFKNMLVFRRAKSAEADQFQPRLLPSPLAVETKDEATEEPVIHTALAMRASTLAPKDVAAE